MNFEPEWSFIATNLLGALFSYNTFHAYSPLPPIHQWALKARYRFGGSAVGRECYRVDSLMQLTSASPPETSDQSGIALASWRLIHVHVQQPCQCNVSWRMPPFDRGPNKHNAAWLLPLGILARVIYIERAEWNAHFDRAEPKVNQNIFSAIIMVMLARTIYNSKNLFFFDKKGILFIQQQKTPKEIWKKNGKKRIQFLADISGAWKLEWRQINK